MTAAGDNGERERQRERRPPDRQDPQGRPEAPAEQPPDRQPAETQGQRRGHGGPPDPEPDTSAARNPGPRPSGWLGFVYDLVSSVLAVLLVGAFLFTVSGVWPPLVAVESGSMVPNMERGDLVFVMEEHRFAGSGAVADTGVVTARAGNGSGFRSFNGPGDVIVFAPDGDAGQTPIIHRARFWVEEGENWYDRADKDFIDANACEADALPETDTALPNCPAPHAGFITKGDANDRYDQVTSLSEPVKPEWVVGTAEVRIPELGWIRLQSQ